MARKKVSKDDYEQILLEAIDEALSSLGENVKASIYFHLNNLFKIKKNEIPFRIDSFIDALWQIFGVGASYLEILFMKSLHAKLRLTCKWPTWSKWVIPEVTFEEYVNLIRQKFEEEDTKENKIEVYVNVPQEQIHHV